MNDVLVGCQTQISEQRGPARCARQKGDDSHPRFTSNSKCTSPIHCTTVGPLPGSIAGTSSKLNCTVPALTYWYFDIKNFVSPCVLVWSKILIYFWKKKHVWQVIAEITSSMCYFFVISYWFWAHCMLFQNIENTQNPNICLQSIIICWE